MIALEGIAIQAGGFSLRNVTFTVETGHWAMLMGQTGSGKTTLIEIICGLRQPQAGKILLDGRDVTALRPADRGIGYVPQDRALFQTMTVRENLAFALNVRRWPADEVELRVAELAELLKLTSLLNRYPPHLSGGESQRVALGRALAARPSLLCLDEPLSALDDITRDEIRAVLRSVREHTRVTTLHITHHREDAMGLADEVLVLRRGEISAEVF